MLDIRFIVENKELIVNNLKKRRSSIDISNLISQYEQHKETLQKVEILKAERNKASLEIGKMKAQKLDTKSAQESVRTIGEEIKTLDAIVSSIEEELQKNLLKIPNILQETVPDGADENDNKEVRKWGEVKSFNFTPKPHWELGENLGILDFERASKIAGARFSVLKGMGAALERALISFMLDVHIGQHGYTEISPPYLTNRRCMTGTGQFPKMEEDAFKVSGVGEYFLIPTAEVPVTCLHVDEILSEEMLPIYYVASTPCFRAEAGSYGKDVRGLIRQHQFHKVEIVKLAHPDNSLFEHEELTSNAEKILQLLELPYRVMLLSSGDTGFSSSKTYDLEVWLPGQNTYREISSCSNFMDFQARRSNIRFRPKDGGKPKFVHTLNGSALAVGRTFLAILENYQQEDGSILVPKALRQYFRTDIISNKSNIQSNK